MCEIDGCHKPVVARGWCEAHYTRWKRHGNPLKRVKLRGEAIKFYREVVLTYDGDECLDWPFTTNGKGYGWVSINGVGKVVPTAVCEEVHGPRPSKKHVAAHSCGRGHLRCCARAHIRWATYKENSADMVIHGTRPRGERQGSNKLSEKDVLEIYSLKNGSLHQDEVASLYGVGKGQVGKIWRGEQWSWLTLS